MDKLFTQFARFDMEKNRNIEGTGLGLSLAKRLTDLMHGTLDLQSIYGVGTSVPFTVPQQVVDFEPVGNFQQKYLSVADKGETYHQSFEAPDARILVVDDVAVNLKVISNLLKSTKITVDTAISGRRCLGMVQQVAYDLIFMDHMMPEMDGVDTYAEMRKLESIILKYLPKKKCRWEAVGADAAENADTPEALTELIRLYPRVDLSKGLKLSR